MALCNGKPAWSSCSYYGLWRGSCFSASQRLQKVGKVNLFQMKMNHEILSSSLPQCSSSIALIVDGSYIFISPRRCSASVGGNRFNFQNRSIPVIPPSPTWEERSRRPDPVYGSGACIMVMEPPSPQCVGEFWEETELGKYRFHPGLDLSSIPLCHIRAFSSRSWLQTHYFINLHSTRCKYM